MVSESPTSFILILFHPFIIHHSRQKNVPGCVREKLPLALNARLLSSGDASEFVIITVFMSK